MCAENRRRVALIHFCHWFRTNSASGTSENPSKIALKDDQPRRVHAFAPFFVRNASLAHKAEHNLNENSFVPFVAVSSCPLWLAFLLTDSKFLNSQTHALTAATGCIGTLRRASAIRINVSRVTRSPRRALVRVSGLRSAIRARSRASSPRAASSRSNAVASRTTPTSRAPVLGVANACCLQLRPGLSARTGGAARPRWVSARPKLRYPGGFYTTTWKLAQSTLFAAPVAGQQNRKLQVPPVVALFRGK